MIKPFLLKELLTGLKLPLLSRWTSLSRQSPFCQEVVYSVDDGRSLRQKSIHHEQENSMLMLSICVINGQPFLRHSIVWRQICEIDYWTPSKSLWVKINVLLHWENVHVSCSKNLKTLLLIYFNSFPIFSPNLSCQTRGAANPRVRLICQCLWYLRENPEVKMCSFILLRYTKLFLFCRNL